MKRIYLVLLVLISSGVLFSQSERLQSMGGQKFSLPDVQYGLNPFDFGDNPAWLYKDETDSWLKIIPRYSGYEGDYKRRYDPGRQNLYTVKFSGIKTLGEDGTFMGETAYEYDQRKAVPNSLKYNTYSGEAFFLTDTATGNFRYNGPSIRFLYSFEPVGNLFTGASVSYRILDGLKNIYSRAEILYRDIEANIGAAYQTGDNLVFGLNYIYKDNQENIESKSEDLLDVEVFNFKGDTYSLLKRSGTVSQKLTGIGHQISGQIYYSGKPTEAALTGFLRRSSQKILMSKAVTGVSKYEYEEGHTSFNIASVELRARHEVFSSFFVGITGGYNHNYVWSENSPNDRLLWEWKINSAAGGAGFSWQPVKSVWVAAEYEYASLDIDSSKFIDARFFSAVSGDHSIRTGIEYQFTENIYIRGGYRLSTYEKDVIFGGSGISVHNVSAGLGLYIFQSLGIDVHLEYGFYKGLPEKFRRSNYSAFTSLKLYSF